MKKRIAVMLIYDILGSLFLGCSIVCFAVQASFAPGGVNGLAVMANYLFHVPIGLATVIINIPIILLTFRKLGKEFFLISVKSMLISSFFIDYVICHFPVYTGGRLAASILAGIAAGIGYSLFFNEGSSTGGTDFVIVAVKQDKSKIEIYGGEYEIQRAHFSASWSRASQLHGRRRSAPVQSGRRFFPASPGDR